jgi:hypothetical protein
MDSWLRAHGATISPAVQLCARFPASGRGVGAVAAVAAGRDVLRVPASCVITAASAARRLQPWLSVALFGREEHDELLIALFLLIEAADPASDWAPYVATLPPLEDLCGILSEWPTEALRELADPSTIAAAAIRKATLQEEYDAVRRAIAGGAGSDDDAVRAVATRLSAALSWRSFCWARHCVTSRAFTNGLDADPLFVCEGTRDMLGIALVPGADMLNHEAVTHGECGAAEEGVDDAVVNSGGAASAGGDGAASLVVCCDTEWEHPSSSPATSTGLDTDVGTSTDSGGFYVVRTTGQVSPGAELRISYGERSGRDLLENYGFLPLPAVPATARARVDPSVVRPRDVVAAANAHESVVLPARQLLAAAVTAGAAPSSEWAPQLPECSPSTLALRRRLLLEATGIDPAAALSKETANPTAVALGDATTREREDVEVDPSVEVLELPLLRIEDGDTLPDELIRALRAAAMSDDDVAALRREHGLGPALDDGSGVAGVGRARITIERLERPVTRDNELAALRLLAALILRECPPGCGSGAPDGAAVGGLRVGDEGNAQLVRVLLASADELGRRIASDVLQAREQRPAATGAISRSEPASLARPVLGSGSGGGGGCSGTCVLF